MTDHIIELDSEEASDLRRWLSADGSRREPLSSGYQGAVYLYDGPNGPRIVKESLGSGLQYRIGHMMLMREYRAYQRLSGITGIPACYGLIDERYLVLEYIQGSSIREPENGNIDRQVFFANLLDIIKQMHAAGVAHNDLKRKDNVLVTSGGWPVLLDFGMSYLNTGQKESPLFRLMKRMDFNSWIKIKYHYATDQITEEDLPYYNPSPLERWFRQLRKFWRTITFRQWRKSRQERKTGR